MASPRSGRRLEVFQIDCQVDTIAAVATPPGEGGIAIVRVSGPGARDVMDKCFRARGECVPGRLRYGQFYDGDEWIDEGMAVFLPAPNTYTREDVLECNCHGGRVVSQRVLAAVLRAGARIAQPGEFTRRAFLNGRIDLAKAEAVMDLISAGSEAAARAALRQLDGGVSRFVMGIAERLTELLSLIEACDDFPDEVDEPDAAARVRAGLDEIARGLASACDPRAARVLRDGLSVALVGRPNVGKSSLLNALLNEERAIVTSSPGTTRDVLSEYLRLGGGVQVRLSDTAGLREARDEAEAMGVLRAQKELERADVVLLVLDASQPLTREDRKLIAQADGRYILVMNKVDLPHQDWLEEMEFLPISAKTGAGIADLMEILRAEACAHTLTDAQMATERHVACASRALASLDRARQSLLDGNPLDLAAVDILEALDALYEITGENAKERVIDKVFERFCVGK